MREGLIGDIYPQRGLCYKWRDTIGTKAVSDPPSYVDYDLWQGPAQRCPSRKIASTTTGTGIGRTATATSATRAFTRSRYRALGPGSEVPDQGHAIGGKFMFDDDQGRPTPSTARSNSMRTAKQMMNSRCATG
jgi:hypothetical protein